MGNAGAPTVAEGDDDEGDEEDEVGDDRRPWHESEQRPRRKTKLYKVANTMSV